MTTQSEKPPPQRQRLASAAILLGIIAVIIGTVTVYIAGDYQLTQPAATVLGGGAVLGAAIITFFGGRLSRLSQESTARDERESRERTAATELAHTQTTADREHQAAITRDLRTRYTTCAEQLANPSAAIRLAGVYALTALADDWNQHDNPDEKQVAIDLLAAYLRTPNTHYNSQGALEPGEIEVRKTIFTTLHKRRTDTILGPDKTWKDCTYELTRADLRGIHFPSEMDLSGLNLTFVDLSDTAMMHVDLTNSRLFAANFTNAELIDVNFTNATLIRADFTNAELISVSFRKLRNWQLEDTDFRNTDLSNATLDQSNFTRAKTGPNTKWPGHDDDPSDPEATQ